MIGYLDGRVLETHEDRVLLAVGADDGRVGYLVAVPKRPEYLQIPNGSRIAFYVYSHIREDAFDLYGFLNPREKEMFQCLIGVNGVGPKMALSILSHLEPQVIFKAVMTQNSNLLSGISGVGSKTVERLLMELKGPLKKREASWSFASYGSGASVKDAEPTSAYQEARQALLGLGYRESDVEQTLSLCAKKFEHAPSVSELIREALRLSQGASK